MLILRNFKVHLALNSRYLLRLFTSAPLLFLEIVLILSSRLWVFFSSVRIRNLERVHGLLTPPPKFLPWLCATAVSVPFTIVRLISKRYRFYLRGERFVQRFLFRLVSSLLCKARCNLRSYIISGLMSLP